MTDLDKLTKQRERILELIVLISDTNTPEISRIGYHDRCLLLLRNYCGDDFNELIDKYLKAEWRI